MATDLPRLFIGSSTEGLTVARSLQAELETAKVCEVDSWHLAFEPSGYAIHSLVTASRSVDFAVLVATPDDVLHSREKVHQAVRDNVIFEFGLFIGALGLERTYLLSTESAHLHLPTDLQGLTRLPYSPRSDGNQRAAMNSAVLTLQGQVSAHGKRDRSGGTTSSASRESRALRRELEVLCSGAIAQGWVVRANTDTTLRLVSPRGRTVTMTKVSSPAATRMRLRLVARKLRGEGLRINSSIRGPVEDSALLG